MFRRSAALISQRFHSTTVEYTPEQLAQLQALFSEEQVSQVFPTIKDISVAETLRKPNTYFIERSAMGNLPVYTEFKKQGKSVVVTEIRKISGDAILLRNDLQKALPYIDAKHFVVKPQSKKIQILGNYVEQVKSVLSQKF